MANVTGSFSLECNGKGQEVSTSKRNPKMAVFSFQYLVLFGEHCQKKVASLFLLLVLLRSECPAE